MTIVPIASILDSPTEHWLATPVKATPHEIPVDGPSAADRSLKIMHKFAVLGEMTSGIVHDLRNIFGVLDASLRLVERNIDEPNTSYAYIGAAREAVRRGAELTSQLMDFARTPGPGVEVCAADVNECLTDLEPLLRFSAGLDNPLILDLQPNLPSCQLNRTQFEMAILNLVNNSRDASPSGREIRIATGVVDGGPCGQVRVRVIDDGSGMSPEVLNRIFDPFFTTKGDHGTGIGLPQIQAIMKLIGGSISVTSELGVGTAVDLMFPAIDVYASVTAYGGLGERP
jgi:signal transduction histidine kinase